jgi:hypothetical protein
MKDLKKQKALEIFKGRKKELKRIARLVKKKDESMKPYRDLIRFHRHEDTEKHIQVYTFFNATRVLVAEWYGTLGKHGWKADHDNGCLKREEYLMTYLGWRKPPAWMTELYFSINRKLHPYTDFNIEVTMGYPKVLGYY